MHTKGGVEMFYSTINTDFAAYQPKLAFGLTRRQCFCFALAGGVGIPIYMKVKEVVPVDLSAILMILIMLPFFAFALYKKEGQPLEKVIKCYVKEQYLTTKVRKVKMIPVLEQVEQTADYAKYLKSGKAVKDENGQKKKVVMPSDESASNLLKKYASFMGKGPKKKEYPKTAADTIPFEKMNESGICEHGKGRYSIAFSFSDMNYVQLDDSDQKDIWSLWCMFLNTLDSDAHFQFFYHNHFADVERYAREIAIADTGREDLDELVEEMNAIQEKETREGNKGLEKGMYLIISFSLARNKVKDKVNEYAERIRNDMYDKLGVEARMLDGYEYLTLLFHVLNPASDEKAMVRFTLPGSGGISEKEQIICHPFVFGKSADRFEIGSKKAVVSFLKLDANQISDRLLCKLLDTDCEVAISIHVEPISRSKASKDIRILVSDLQKNVIDEQKKASNGGYGMNNISAPLKANLEAAQSTLDGITKNDERMFIATITIMHIADTYAQLERNIHMAKAIANEENCDLIALEHQQEDGFITTLPLGIGRVDIKRQLLTTSLGMFLPFKIRELMQRTENAIHVGINKITGKIIMGDVTTLANPNTLILGTPGRGKSVFAKLMIIWYFFKTKIDIMICDIEGEYLKVVERLGGITVNLSQSGKVYINMLDINPGCDWQTDPISEKTQFMMSVFEQILGVENGDPIDKSIIDRCMRKIYQRFAKTKDIEDIPVLEDLYDEIRRQEGERAAYLADALEVYVHGSLNYFNHRTNVDMDNRLINFNTKELGAQLRPLAMLLVQESVWGRISGNRDQGRYTLYIVDEAHVLLREPQTALYCVNNSKRCRKWGGIPVLITQNVSDFLDSPQIQTIFYNTDCFILLGQASGDADRLKEALNLSDEQYKCLLTRNKGEGLYIFGDTVLPFINRIDNETMLYKLVTTKVTEM